MRQLIALLRYAILSIPKRLGSAAVLVFSVATVVAVLTSVLALSAGLLQNLSASASPERAIVLRRDVDSEVSSYISRDALRVVQDAPGVWHDAENEPAISPEAVMSINILESASGETTSVLLRGVSPSALQRVRGEVAIDNGRLYRSGIYELIVGKNLQRRMPEQFRIGETVVLNGRSWRIVGSFVSGGNARESELLADTDTMLQAYGRVHLSAITVRLRDPAQFSAFEASVSSNPSLPIEARREVDYYTDQGRRIATLLRGIAIIVGTVMVIGALFAVANAMHAAFETRTREVATLRAFGYSAIGLVGAFVLESVALALLGGSVGGAAAWLFFDGASASTLINSGFSTTTFRIAVTSELVTMGMALACIIGLAGAVFPAIRAARRPVAAALQEI